MNIHGIIQYALGSAFLGIFFALVGIALLFVLIKGFYRNSTFTPLSICVAVVLFFLLAYQFILVCGAVKIKNLSDDVRMTINQQLPSYWTNTPLPITPRDSQTLLDVIVDDYPLVGEYLNLADFQGYNTTTIANAMVDEINSYMNKLIWKHVGWSLLFICIGAFIVIKTMDVIKSIKRSSRMHARPHGQHARSRYIHGR